MTTGIIGKPIKHSLSPILHEFWMKEHKIESTYNIYEIDKNNIASFLKSLKEKNINGLNVTIPYKSEVIKFLDHVEKNALDLGAVNTIKVGENNKLYGYNTDVYGFMEHLNSSAPSWKTKKGCITIIGAGGASRAVIWSFLKENKMDIKLFNRSKDKGLKLIEDMKKLFPASNIILCSDLSEALYNCSLLVNCTSLGMNGQPQLSISLEQMNNNSIVYDIVYTPLITELLHKAKKLNFTAIDGLGMLINQAVPAFEMWHNTKVTVSDTLRRSALNHLERKPK
tara:strand:- start:618 stop:1463 length:846 start_codon:yes stop_codon:yes gene_type:complete